MHHIKWYARRANFVFAAIAATAAQFGQISLFNDSTIGHILRLRWWSVAFPTTNNVYATIVAGSVGTKLNSSARIYSGEPAGAGSSYATSTATTPTPGLLVAQEQWFAQAVSDLPLFYLTPGYSLVFTGNLVNTVLQGSWIYEDLEMSMLEECELV